MRPRQLLASLLAGVLLLVAMAPAAAVFEDFQFDTPEQQRRFDRLLIELRCLVCQNQALSDSNAPLAADLRQVVYEQITQGADDERIIAYLTERYGSFVLYQPPFTVGTALLWLAPLLALAFGLGMLALMAKAGRREGD